MRTNRYIIVVIIIITLCMACSSYRYSVDENFNVPLVAFKKIPLTACLCLPDSLCQYEFKVTQNDEDPSLPYTFLYGSSICYGIEKMFKEIFEDVIVVNQHDSTLMDFNISAYIEPEIVSCSYLVTKKYESFIRIRYILKNKNQQIIWMDTFQGEGSVEPSTMKLLSIPNPFKPMKTVEDIMRKCMKLTLEDHFNKAIKGITFGMGSLNMK
jgi:hypothetical protein